MHTYGFPKPKVQSVDQETWEAEPPYDNYPATKLQCIACGGTHFEVGSGDYLTAIRCINCMESVVVHSG